MKIAIVGAGAMGSVYAALLADAGNEVWAIDIWKEHINAIASTGLRVEGASGDRTVTGIHAATSLSDAGACDLYIIATKADGVGPAARDVAASMRDDSLVLTIQNGLGAGERIAEHMDTANVLLGVAAGFGASMRGPGHAHHNSMSLIRIGEINGGLTERVERIAQVWRDAGFNVKAYDDIEQLVWEKFICNATYSAPCTVFGCTIGEILDTRDRWEIAKGCALEIHALGVARGVRFGFDDPVAYVTEFGRNMPNARPSMLLDHMAGRRSEIGAINGMAEVLGAELGIATPYNQTLSAIIRDRESRFG
ncbi:MAG: ketopantoate reductase family protein [Minwuia sp.]|uniref:ketopantoate reductase family protein n=1 Tax=Minwuia sp. TaxID=2493630 RepID=UPI003A85A6CB